jgi:hypothetical protein
MSCHLMLATLSMTCYGGSFTFSFYVIFSYITLRYVMLHYVTLRSPRPVTGTALPFHIILSYVMSYYVMLLCYAMLCCAMLCYDLEDLL